MTSNSQKFGKQGETLRNKLVPTLNQLVSGSSPDRGTIRRAVPKRRNRRRETFGEFRRERPAPKPPCRYISSVWHGAFARHWCELRRRQSIHSNKSPAESIQSRQADGSGTDIAGPQTWSKSVNSIQLRPVGSIDPSSI